MWLLHNVTTHDDHVTCQQPKGPVTRAPPTLIVNMGHSRDAQNCQGIPAGPWDTRQLEKSHLHTLRSSAEISKNRTRVKAPILYINEMPLY